MGPALTSVRIQCFESLEAAAAALTGLTSGNQRLRHRIYPGLNPPHRRYENGRLRPKRSGLLLCDAWG